MAKAYKDYSVADLKRLSLSFLLKDEDKAKDQQQAFMYLTQIAYSSNIHIDNIKLLQVFGDDENPLMVTDKAEINKRLFEYQSSLPVATNNFGMDKLKATKRAIIDLTKTDFDSELSKLERNIESYLSNSRNYYQRYEEHISNASTAMARKHTVEQLKLSGAYDDSIYNAVVDILRNSFWQFITIDGPNAVFATTQPVIQKYVNPSANINISVNLGVIVAKIDLTEKSIRCERGLSCLSIISSSSRASYFHPHISSTGSICWGDASDDASNYLVNNNFYELFTLLQALLITYEPSNPYMGLGTMNERIQPERLTWKDTRKDGAYGRELYTIIPEVEPLPTPPAPFSSTDLEMVENCLVWSNSKRVYGIIRNNIVPDLGKYVLLYPNRHRGMDVGVLSSDLDDYTVASLSMLDPEEREDASLLAYINRVGADIGFPVRINGTSEIGYISNFNGDPTGGSTASYPSWSIHVDRHGKRTSISYRDARLVQLPYETDETFLTRKLAHKRFTALSNDKFRDYDLIKEEDSDDAEDCEDSL